MLGRMNSPIRSDGPDGAAPDIRVQVNVQYMADHSTPERHLFMYVIHIENRSDDTWQLLARHWDIMDATGRVTRVDGEGVVGEQPVLPPGGSFTYDSFVTVEATPASIRALPTARPVVSQPPPGLAGSIIFMAVAAWADSGRAPAAASAIMDLRKVSRRMSVSPLLV